MSHALLFSAIVRKNQRWDFVNRCQMNQTMRSVVAAVECFQTLVSEIDRPKLQKKVYCCEMPTHRTWGYLKIVQTLQYFQHQIPLRTDRHPGLLAGSHQMLEHLQMRDWNQMMVNHQTRRHQLRVNQRAEMNRILNWFQGMMHHQSQNQRTTHCPPAK